MMNKKIASEIALGIIVLIALALGGIFWMQNKESLEQVATSSTPQQQDKIRENAQQPTQSQINNTNIPEGKVGEEYYKKEINDGYATGWKLVFVNGGVDNVDEECAAHVYEGTTKVGGWYTYEEMYSDKYWFLNIAYYYDKNGKKIFNDTNNIPKVRIVDAPNDLREKLKKASKNNPAELTIQGLYSHCEGSVVSVDLGRKAFADDIKAGIWTHNNK